MINRFLAIFFAKVEMSTKFCFVASQRLLSSRHGTCSSLHTMAS